jgi:hypothetical protein
MIEVNDALFLPVITRLVVPGITLALCSKHQQSGNDRRDGKQHLLHNALKCK